MTTKDKFEGTIMYSIAHPVNGPETIVVHKLPWKKDAPFSAKKFQALVDRGFTFERPKLPDAPVKEQIYHEVSEPQVSKPIIETILQTYPEPIIGDVIEIPKFKEVPEPAEPKVEPKLVQCPECQGIFKEGIGMISHMRSHKKEKNKLKKGEK